MKLVWLSNMADTKWFEHIYVFNDMDGQDISIWF